MVYGKKMNEDYADYADYADYDECDFADNLDDLPIAYCFPEPNFSSSPSL